MMQPPSIPDQPAPAGGDRVRRRLLVWSAAPVLLLLFVAVKLLSLPIFAGLAADAFAAKDSGALEAAAGGLNLANVVERHKAPFAAGDARVLSRDYPAARLLFEDALALVPGGSGDDCIIRVNLSLAIETIGDGKLRTEDPSSAATLFAEALEVVQGASEGCFAGASATEAGKQLADAEGRLTGKLDATAPNGAQGESRQEENPGEDASPQQSQLEMLEEGSRRAERERNGGREREDYLRDTDYGPGPDRPW